MQKRKLNHIVILTPSFPKNEKDTQCIPALQDFFRTITKLHPNLQITCFALHYPFSDTPYFWNNIKVIPFGARNRNVLYKIPFWIRFKKSLDTFLKSENVDLVHSFWLDEVTWLSQRIIRKNNLKLTCTLMGQDAIGRNRYHRKIEFDSQDLVCLSKFHENAAFEYLNRKVGNVIPWGIDLSESVSQERTIDIINIGNFNDVKNQVELIHVTKELIQYMPNVKVVFVGSGSKLNDSKKLVSSLNLFDNIHFTGAVERKKVYRLLSQSKLLVHNSTYESFGMIYLEALANGVAVMSRPIGIASEIKSVLRFNNKSELIELLKTYDFSQEQYVPQMIRSSESVVNDYLRFWENKFN